MVVCHIITGLNNGGAEAVLYRLVTHDKAHKHVVISLMDEGKYGGRLQEKGIDLVCLNMPKGRLNLSGLIKLWRSLKNYRPDVVQTWMYHADIVGGLISRMVGIRNIFWNIRHTELVSGVSSKNTIIIARLCARLSGFLPYKIICCAEKALDVHSKLGYKKEKMLVISNGYDLDEFRFDIERKVRIINDIPIKDELVLGMVGRFNAQKDHENLLKALVFLKNRSVGFKCFLVGPGVESESTEIVELLKDAGLYDSVYLLGQRSDIPAVMNSLDIHILSSSFGEGFPNVIAEAMACGTPCVTTDVGDAAIIVGQTGWIVPPKKPVLLADAIEQAYVEMKEHPLTWRARKLACRNRIADNFGIDVMVKKYHSAWGCN